MATLAMLLGGALVNALAFSGSNYLFSKLRSSEAEVERKRHDKALEQLQAAQAEWSRKRADRLDWINQQLRRQGHAIQTFQDVDDAIVKYSEVTGQSLESLAPEPRLSDFYTPSDTQKEGELAFILLGITAVGIAAYKLK